MATPVNIVIASKKTSLADCITYAKANSLGIEVKDFSSLGIFKKDWREKALETKKYLNNFPGTISLHSIIYDYPGKWSEKILKEIYKDLSDSLEVAKIIGASTLIVHSSYFPGISKSFYEEWLSFQVELWGKLSQIAANNQITIALENIIDPSPSSIKNVIEAVNNKYFKVCIDFGHLNLVSSPYSNLEWIDILKEYLHYVHLHNNNGIYDLHNALDTGTIDYNEVLKALIDLEHSPILALEVDQLSGVQNSLELLKTIYSCRV